MLWRKIWEIIEFINRVDERARITCIHAYCARARVVLIKKLVVDVVDIVICAMVFVRQLITCDGIDNRVWPSDNRVSQMQWTSLPIHFWYYEASKH